MKKVLKKITVSLAAMLMAVSSTSAVLGSANAADNVQPRGTWAMYGDVNNDGSIDLADSTCIYIAYSTFENLTGDTRLPLSYAVARPEVYFKTTYIVPQAADVDGDGYITNADEMCVSYYDIGDHSKSGRCGQAFYIK